MRSGSFLLSLLISFLITCEATAQDYAEADALRPRLEAHRVDAPIQIDGRLDEPAWQEAPVTGPFEQYEPIEGATPSQPSEVRVLYDENNLYIGAYLYDEAPNEITSALGRRDHYNRADWLLVSIDSYFDHKSAYTFGVNAAGVQFDAHQTGGRGGLSFGAGYGSSGGAPQGMDESWDAIWYSAHRITARGWIVEMRIPYSMLRFSELDEQTWGIHFLRWIPRLGEQSEWPLVPRTKRASLVANIGLLTGIRNVKPKRNIQFSPYTVGKLQREEAFEPAGSIASTSEADIGADLKVGLGPNVTLDMTVNPDFGQVESDPAVLNLTAFETRYPEKRPFFLEGMQIYQFDIGRATLPYSRRIGGTAPIIGAAKLSGRTAGGFSFGLISASTGYKLKPERHYEVVRLMQQIGSYSSLGFMATGFDAAGPDDVGRKRSSFIGSDYDVRLAGNQYNIAGFVGFTRRWWTAADIDAETGFGLKFLMNKRLGAFTGWIGLEGYDKRFDINDVGQIRQNDYYSFPFRVNYELNGGRPFGPFLRASVGDYASQQFSWSDGLDMGQSHRISFSSMLRNFQTFGLGSSVGYLFGGYDIYETRGLGPWAAPSDVGFQVEWQSDSRKDWRLGPSVSFTTADNGGHELGLGVAADLNVGSRFIFSGSVETEWEYDMMAWSSNETFLSDGEQWLIGVDSSSPDAPAPEAFTLIGDPTGIDDVLAGVTPYADNRYYMPVFGARDTRALDITLRNTTTFTKDLSLQIYSQLFLARGRYADFQLLRDRDHLVPIPGFPKRDEFSLTSLQSNIVLRWEYRPGSVLFAVWTHGRNDSDALNPLAPWFDEPYDRGIGDQISQTFDTIPTNVFLVKFSYAMLN